MIGTNELRTQLSIAAVAIALFCGIANAEELSKRITTDGNPKAKGLSLQMDFPADWKLEEGKRPNVVIKAIKKLGEGRVAVCATTIHLNENARGKSDFTLPPVVVNAIKAEPQSLIDELAEKNRLTNYKGGSTLVDGEVGVWVSGTRNEERLGLKIFSQTLVTMYFYKKWIATSTCMVSEHSDAAAKKAYKYYELLFKKIIFSTVINSKWRQ